MHNAESEVVVPAEETVSPKGEKFRLVFTVAVILVLVFAGSITVGVH